MHLDADDFSVTQVTINFGGSKRKKLQLNVRPDHPDSIALVSLRPGDHFLDPSTEQYMLVTRIVDSPNRPRAIHVDPNRVKVLETREIKVIFVNAQGSPVESVMYGAKDIGARLIGDFAELKVDDVYTCPKTGGEYPVEAVAIPGDGQLIVLTVTQQTSSTEGQSLFKLLKSAFQRTPLEDLC